MKKAILTLMAFTGLAAQAQADFQTDATVEQIKGIYLQHPGERLSLMDAMTVFGLISAEAHRKAIQNGDTDKEEILKFAQYLKDLQAEGVLPAPVEQQSPSPTPTPAAETPVGPSEQSDAQYRSAIIGYWNSSRHMYLFKADGLILVQGSVDGHWSIRNGVIYEQSVPDGLESAYKILAITGHQLVFKILTGGPADLVVTYSRGSRADMEREYGGPIPSSSVFSPND